MNRTIRIIKYFVSCAKAITEGLEVVGNNWPTDSPFVNPVNRTQSKGEPSGRASESVSNTAKQVREVVTVHNSTGKA